MHQLEVPVLEVYVGEIQRISSTNTDTGLPKQCQEDVLVRGVPECVEIAEDPLGPFCLERFFVLLFFRTRCRNE